MSKSEIDVNQARRSFLGVGAGFLLSNPVVGVAQTLLENSPSSGQGWEPTPPTQRIIPQAYAEKEATPQDWRQYLLSGERSILLRRDGPAKRIRYCTKDGRLDAAGYGAACFILRDAQAGKMSTMDPRLLDVLCGIQRWMEYNGRSSVIDITSGFRTTKTNLSTEGSAKNSMHLYGRAADIVISGASSGLVGAMAKQFNSAGGTGIYLRRGFVHVDTGFARTWISSQSRRR